MPTIHLNQTELYYESQGHGQPLLFVHGLGAGTWTWEAQVHHFKNTFETWVPELRGHGRSEKTPGPYSIDIFARDLICFIAAQGLSQVHLIGLSMGGIIAYEIAAQRPDLVASLVIVNCGPEVSQSNMQVQWAMWQREIFMHLLSMEGVSRILAARLFPDADQATLRQRFVEHWAKNDKASYEAAFHALITWKGGNCPERIKCPALFVTTPDDYTPLQLKQRYVTRMSDGRLVIVPNSRHVTPLDQPEAFNQVLAEFYEEMMELA
ncbi:MAG: alpha/beta hydrolase [Microscillaceae bacterium]